MKLSYFPQVKVVHTSKRFFGQLYVPLLNWLLMIGTVLVAAIYNNVSIPLSFLYVSNAKICRPHPLGMLTGMSLHISNVYRC
jgi:K+ potassium transporter